MIKILTEGKRRFKVTCERCLCVFEYDLSDLVKYLSCEYVQCPHCKHDVMHEPNISLPEPPKGE